MGWSAAVEMLAKWAELHIVTCMNGGTLLNKQDR